MRDGTDLGWSGSGTVMTDRHMDASSPRGPLSALSLIPSVHIENRQLLMCSSCSSCISPARKHLYTRTRSVFVQDGNPLLTPSHISVRTIRSLPIDLLGEELGDKLFVIRP